MDYRVLKVSDEAAICMMDVFVYSEEDGFDSLMFDIKQKFPGDTLSNIITENLTREVATELRDRLTAALDAPTLDIKDADVMRLYLSLVHFASL